MEIEDFWVLTNIRHNMLRLKKWGIVGFSKKWYITQGKLKKNMSRTQEVRQKLILFYTLLEFESLRQVLAYNKFVYINFQFVKVEIVIFSVQNLTHLHLTYAEKNSKKNLELKCAMSFWSTYRDIRHNQKRLRQLWWYLTKIPSP